ncbi:uncharacterized protein LOC126885522 [Diabrotica virgifera virgifera]|uniref:Peptidase aspartic putative domain-containing protein n=1 Tax=Diabrotica virgifera virgifera TaxID=50390 RepID=A0ABM5KD07_DIAVI|nr:uncharacterized protein LOC126885522 [Diabrotica virgifera virgifera]
MQNLKLERETIKGSLKKVFKEIEEVNPSDEKTIQRLLQQVDDKAERVFLLDNSIKDILFAEETSTEEISKKLNDEENFRDEVGKFRIECEYLIKNLKTLKDQENKGTKNEKPVKNLHLPKLEIKKYDGNVKNWINFWGQFRKIDEDADLPNEDKFQYLIQSTEDGTPARSLVESFPPSAENYKIAIDQLKNRFARDEILIEVYVRELLNLILNQQTSKEDPCMALSTLYDRLETQLRALGTLGVTSDKYAAMLLPLVESALPYELLKIWERNRASNNLKFNNELQGLLEFLKTEVEAEERVKLAQSSFTVPKSIDDKYTVETLHTESLKTKGKQKFSCIFYESNTHASQDCIKAQKMTLEQKKSIISKKRSCFSCLKQFHNFRTCKTTVKCIKCARKHFTLMCPDLHEKENKNRDLQKSESLENTLTTVASETLLQTINVRVISDNKRSMTVRALLDSGSQRSYITTKCAEDLGLTKIGQENIVQGVFGGLQGTPKIHRLFKAGIENLENSFSIGLSLLEQSKICNYVPKLIDQKVLDLLKDKNIYINDSASKELEVNLLIGADMFGHIITGNLVNINDSLVALETKFGWTVMGTQKSNNKINTFVSTYFTDSLSTLWSLDVLGIKDPAETKCREELDIRTLEKFKESTVVNSENRYEVCLPWAEGYPAITSNFNLAEKRLFSTTKRLLSLNKLTEYDNIFQDWENTGIIEEVEEEPLEKNTHYLAHHAVVKESSLTTKIRPVFDASAKDGNGYIKLGVTSDIAKAFLQISISEKDRDFLRFLWWKNYEKREIKIFRHCRVVFGLKPSPFLLAATVNLHLEKEKTYTETANQFLNAFCVDNCVSSVRNETELKKFIDESTEILKNAKFDIRGWTFNENNDTYVSSVNEKLENKVISILGIQWNYQTDTLACDIKNLDSVDEIPRTKRGILSATQRVFDPIGFTAPFTLIPKILLQETWSLKLTWDQKLPDDIKKRFEIWLKSVKCLNFCNIHRYLAYPEEENLIINKTLHVFVDASKYSYAACVFIRLEFQNSISIKLLLAKSRLSPVKTITLPRLELMAAVIGVRLLETVKEVTDFTELKTYYWSDSMVVLTWIKTKGLWNTFVGNRVKEIKKYSAVDQWRHVPGDMNIADVLSRGCSGKQLLEKQWWKGPQRLKEPENMWPKGESKTDFSKWKFVGKQL